MTPPAGPDGRRLRILLVNFEMNEQSRVLAWQRQVACALADRCERLVVMTESGDGAGLPANTECHRVPLLLQKAPLRWMGGRWLMLLPCAWWVLRARVNVCFIHMNMSWAYRLFALLRPLRIPIVMWYAHGTVSRQLRLAHRAAARVVTSSESGFRLSSTKVTIIGQGIDTGLFELQPASGAARDIVTISRISARKRIDLIIAAFAHMRASPRFAQSRLLIVGEPLTRADHECLDSLRAQCANAGIAECVEFVGHVPLDRVPGVYRGVQLHINLSETGSMDKTVLESLAIGCPVLTSNTAFAPLFAQYAPLLQLSDCGPEQIAARAAMVLDSTDGIYSRASLRALVVGHHDLQSFADKLLRVLEQVTPPGKI